MKNKTYFFTVLFFLLAASSGAAAQDSRVIKEKLAAPGMGGARITVSEAGDAASIVRMLESPRKSDKVNGYRVRVFFDNSQNARANAQETKSRFEAMFPDTPAYLDYDKLYFRVSVGNCLTRDEAIILWGQIKGAFDKAFIISEDIQLSAFTKQPVSQKQPEETEL